VTDDRRGSGYPGQRETRVLRPGTPPADQLDFDDRHDTRATESDEMQRRYAALRKEKRKGDWHDLAIGMVAFGAAVAVYLASVLVMSHLLPHSTPRQATQIVGLAFLAAGGGVAGRSAGRTLRQRYARPRGQGSASPATTASPSSPPAQDRLGEHAAGECCHDSHQRSHQEYPARGSETARYSTQNDREHDNAAEPGGNDGGGAD
jgi:hypothetical protein